MGRNLKFQQDKHRQSPDAPLAALVGSSGETLEALSALDATPVGLEWKSYQCLFRELPKLPDGWIYGREVRTAGLYYVNIFTGDVTSNRPQEAAPRRSSFLA